MVIGIPLPCGVLVDPYKNRNWNFFKDYIGGEEEEGGLPIVTSPKRKRKGAFISGTVDIDVLLGNETAPTNLVIYVMVGNGQATSLPNLSTV